MGIIYVFDRLHYGDWLSSKVILVLAFLSAAEQRPDRGQVPNTRQGAS